MSKYWSSFRTNTNIIFIDEHILLIIVCSRLIRRAKCQLWLTLSLTMLWRRWTKWGPHRSTATLSAPKNERHFSRVLLMSWCRRYLWDCEILGMRYFYFSRLLLIYYQCWEKLPAPLRSLLRSGSARSGAGAKNWKSGELRAEPENGKEESWEPEREFMVLGAWLPVFSIRNKRQKYCGLDRRVIESNS